MSALDTARTRLAIDHPFIASAVMRMEWVADDSIGTLAVDGRTGYYAPSWFDTLPMGQRLFCIAHEGLHAMLEHCPMVKAWTHATIGPDGKPYDAARMNRAMDYLINGSLIKEKFEVPTLPNGGRICHDPKWDLNSDLIAVYKALDEGGGNGGKPMDDHRPAVGEPLMDASDVKAAAHVHNAVQGGKGRTDKSDIVEAMLIKFNVPPESPWAILRDKLTRGAPSRMTWQRPNRHLIARGIIAPSAVSEVSEPLAVVVDISGSCVEMAPLFLSHISAIVAESKPQSLIVLFVNTHVVSSWETEDAYAMANELSQVKIPQGGGTDMRAGIDAAVKLQYNKVVVLTDGETPFPKTTTAEIIWALTRSDIKPPVGTTVYIKS